MKIILTLLDWQEGKPSQRAKGLLYHVLFEFSQQQRQKQIWTFSKNDISRVTVSLHLCPLQLYHGWPSFESLSNCIRSQGNLMTSFQYAVTNCIHPKVMELLWSSMYPSVDTQNANMHHMGLYR